MNPLGQQSRTVMTARNVVWGYVNAVVTTFLKFLCRWVFIKTLEAKFLGINGLYLSILGVLSLTELGIGTAMNYSLYKPVAQGDIEKVKSLMVYYKKAYRLIALVIALLGLSLVPFLPLLIKGGQGIQHLRLYYILFLFNTVSSYFVSYKYSLVGAEQKSYIVNNINSCATIIMSIAQIIALYLYKSFLVYLVIQIVFLLVEKIIASLYLDHLYPYLKDKDVVPLDDASKRNLFANVRALIVHKLGDVAVNQTDNIIISATINITATGLISNYTLIIGTVSSFLNILFSNVTGSLGNLCATATTEKQLEIFRIYDFISFWLYSFVATSYIVLIQPFTQLMWGRDYVVNDWVIGLIILNSYLVGQRIPLASMKVVSGIFKEDKFLPAIQAIVNLVVSIVLAKAIGLIGVYVGTIVSGLVPTLVRPVVVYHNMFHESVLNYFSTFFSHLLLFAIIACVSHLICTPLLRTLNWWRFIWAIIIVGVVPNFIIFALYRKRSEFSYLVNAGCRLLRLKKAD